MVPTQWYDNKSANRKSKQPRGSAPLPRYSLEPPPLAGRSANPRLKSLPGWWEKKSLNSAAPSRRLTRFTPSHASPRRACSTVHVAQPSAKRQLTASRLGKSCNNVQHAISIPDRLPARATLRPDTLSPHSFALLEPILCLHLGLE